MNKVRFALLPVLLWVALGGAVFAEGKLPFEMTPTCNASVEFGDIVKGHDFHFNGDLKNVWMEKAIVGFGVQVLYKSLDTLRLAAEMKMFNEYPRILNLGGSRRLYHYPYVREAQAIRSFINGDKVKLFGGIGYFPLKYNSDVRNLGEYLFRSTVYPQTLTTEFDYPYARLLGAYLKTTLFNQLSLDILLSSDQEYMAVNDINGSILGTWKLGRIFEIGAGVSFCSLISADSNATRPKNISSAYIDTVNGKPDTQYYTFAGTKVMARMSFDPKQLFTKDGFGGLLGEQDLRIYTEATLLGTDNYPRACASPVWYMNPLQRIPVMFGFNFPVFKLLDVLSLEAEWWGNPYPNSFQGIVTDGLPLPFAAGKEFKEDSLVYKNDNWKWSVYAKKTFADHFNVIIQVASDHMRTFSWDWQRQDFEESLRGPSSWCYIIKLGALF